MGDKATLRMARQELENLYRGVPDDSVDLTFKDLPEASSLEVSFSGMAPFAAAGGGAGDGRKETKKAALGRSSTNIFTYIPEESDEEDSGGGKQANHVHFVPAGLVLTPSPSPPPAADSAGVDHHNKQQQRRDPVVNGGRAANYKRPGIPHSNICALCSTYVYLFRHRCLVCGRVYCRQCVGAGMGEMTEGRKCIDCLGRRYSHRYINRAGGRLTRGILCSCLWGYYPSAKAVRAQELIWAEKGPAPRRRQRPPSSSTSTSMSTSYAGGYSASMSMTMASNSNMRMTMNGGKNPRGVAPADGPASSSFVASFSGTNPHAFPL